MNRLLTISHSYVVANNRRLAHEMAVQGRGRWEVTALAPARLVGDLREVALEPIAGEACTTERAARPARPHPAPAALRAAAARAARRPVGCRAHLGGAVRRRVRAGRAAAPKAARVVPATFQNIVKSYPPPLGYFERSVMRRATGWIAFGETVHEAQAAKPCMRPGHRG